MWAQHGAHSNLRITRAQATPRYLKIYFGERLPLAAAVGLPPFFFREMAFLLRS